ncbi:uncharacterized protein V1510DRAFT_440767 [Dipodascopsis tothii]|uniref:uncharacterized protein n=1 Tax=Dipodascopsis tothii TaxID=44089 RepID=UPI0034CFF63F
MGCYPGGPCAGWPAGVLGVHGATRYSGLARHNGGRLAHSHTRPLLRRARAGDTDVVGAADATCRSEPPVRQCPAWIALTAAGGSAARSAAHVAPTAPPHIPPKRPSGHLWLSAPVPPRSRSSSRSPMRQLPVCAWRHRCSFLTRSRLYPTNTKNFVFVRDRVKTGTDLEQRVPLSIDFADKDLCVPGFVAGAGRPRGRVGFVRGHCVPTTAAPGGTAPMLSAAVVRRCPPLSPVL